MKNPKIMHLQLNGIMNELLDTIIKKIIRMMMNLDESKITYSL